MESTTRFKIFLIDGLENTICTLIDLNQNSVTHYAVKETFKMYLNLCWHEYHRKNNRYISRYINLILEEHELGCCHCLLHHMKNAGYELIDRVPSFHDCQFVEIRTMLSSLYELHNKHVNFTKTLHQPCGARHYDGSDIFVGHELFYPQSKI
jgi:hypothetical protein